MEKGPPMGKAAVHSLPCQFSSCLNKGTNEHLVSVGIEGGNVNPHNVDLRRKVANMWVFSRIFGKSGASLYDPK